MSELPPSAVEGDSPVRLLLVEDDPEDVLRIRSILENSNLTRFEVSHTDQLEQALAMLQEDRFHVMLLDLSLPESDGVDTLARARVAAASVPIIAMTTEEDERQSLRALRLGAQDCLIKGQSDPRVLVRSLLHAVERHRLVSDLDLARRREHFVANHDSLTGLPNRFALLSQLRRSLSYAARHRKRLALLFLDLDRFKNINDTLGHALGDQLLIQVSHRLRRLVRRSDMVARLGGDEFIVMAQTVDGPHAPAKIAEGIVEALDEPFVLDGHECWVTTSVGIAVFPANGTDPDTLARNADTAMYQAKASGKNTYRFFDDSMNEAARRRLELENRLRRALERDELQLHFQPQVDLTTGLITGAEALLRWTDAELGVVSPLEFIPVAEETGMIVKIGSWVLHEACRQARRWREAGCSWMRVAVNVSALQLEHEKLREVIVEALWQCGLSPDAIELELTENSLIQNRSEKLAVLTGLKEIGVSLALDDFGTGFSSLAYLKRIPVDTVKIDCSFVRDMVIDRDDAAVVGAIISIADKFDLRVIAEGVETDEQRNLLCQLGCHEMQGASFCPPVPSDALLTLLGKGRRL